MVDPTKDRTRAEQLNELSNTHEQAARLPEQPQMPPVREQEAYRPVSPERSPVREQESGPTHEVKADEGFLDETIATLRSKLKGKKKKQIILPQHKDELTLQIERIMQDGLEDAYRELSPLEQQKFKLKGEETAAEIRTLLGRARVKFKKIFKLLVEWLQMLPGVNRFFTEQEAKIKVDKIINLQRRD